MVYRDALLDGGKRQTRLSSGDLLSPLYLLMKVAGRRALAQPSNIIDMFQYYYNRKRTLLQNLHFVTLFSVLYETERLSLLGRSRSRPPDDIRLSSRSARTS